MWAYESVFYQICPLGFCGTPLENDGGNFRNIESGGILENRKIILNKN